MRAFEPLHPRVRVAALSTVAFASITRGLAYIAPPQTGLTLFVDAVVPLSVWAAVWCAAGVMVIVGVWHRVIARWALSLSATLWAVWALSYMIATLVGDSPRGWVTGSLMASLAGLIFVCSLLADSTGPPPGAVIPDEAG